MITFGLMLVYWVFNFDFIIVLSTRSGLAPGLDPVRALPAVLSAYERQLAKQRYYSRQRFTHPETTIRAAGRAGAAAADAVPVPIEIRRFGVGTGARGPAGTTGIEGAGHRERRRRAIAELAFSAAGGSPRTPTPTRPGSS